jgi:hypothetical protein
MEALILDCCTCGFHLLILGIVPVDAIRWKHCQILVPVAAIGEALPEFRSTAVHTSTTCTSKLIIGSQSVKKAVNSGLNIFPNRESPNKSKTIQWKRVNVIYAWSCFYVVAC